MRYFSAIPHLIADMDLSVYEFRLYCHYKRVAGEDGRCWQSVDTIAKACKISQGAAVTAREGLAKRGLIKIERVDIGKGGRDCIVVTLVDVWKENDARYIGESSPGEVQSSPGEVRKKPAKPARKPADPRTGHAAIKSFCAITGKYPNKDVYDLVIAKIGDTPDQDKLKQAWVAWRAKGFSPVNLGWLDWYATGIPTYGNGTKSAVVRPKGDML